MVIMNEELIFVSVQVEGPTLQGLKDGSEFLIVSLISNLGKDHSFGEKRHRMLLANLGLRKNWFRMGGGHVIRKT